MKKITALFLTLIMSFTLPCYKASAFYSCPHVVMVSDTEEIFSQNMAHTRLPIASTTKIITAIVVLENTDDIKKEISVPKEACGIEGSSIYLYEGERITVEALLYGMLLESGNDAATALALATSGSIDEFADLMNEYVCSLGLKDSHFTNPHGLDHPEHYSTAYDLAIIMKNAMDNEDFARISSSKTASFDMPDKTTRYFSNHNRLLKMSDDIIGGKTGFTTVSGRCLVSCAQKDGVRLICVTLGCVDDFNQHLMFYREAFPVYKSYELPIQTGYTVDVVGAPVDSVNVKYNGKASIALGDEKELDCVSIKVHLPRFIYAPVSSGDVVGEVMIYYNDVPVDSSSLVLDEDVASLQARSFMSKVIDFIRRIFGK